jgi:hypothetical protein
MRTKASEAVGDGCEQHFEGHLLLVAEDRQGYPPFEMWHPFKQRKDVKDAARPVCVV